MNAEDRFEGKGLFSKNFFSMFFENGSNTSWTFGQNNLVRWPNWRWKSPGEHFENNVFFEEKSPFSDFETKMFGKGQNLSAVISKVHITWPEKQTKELFLRFEDLFCPFRAFSKNNSERLSKLLSMSPEDRFGKKTYVSDIDVFSKTFGLTANISKALSHKVSCGVSKLHFTYPKKRYFEEEQFL